MKARRLLAGLVAASLLFFSALPVHADHGCTRVKWPAFTDVAPTADRVVVGTVTEDRWRPTTPDRTHWFTFEVEEVLTGWAPDELGIRELEAGMPWKAATDPTCEEAPKLSVEVGDRLAIAFGGKLPGYPKRGASVAFIDGPTRGNPGVQRLGLDEVRAVSGSVRGVPDDLAVMLPMEFHGAHFVIDRKGSLRIANLVAGRAASLLEAVDREPADVSVASTVHDRSKPGTDDLHFTAIRVRDVPATETAQPLLEALFAEAPDLKFEWDEVAERSILTFRDPSAPDAWGFAYPVDDVVLLAIGSVGDPEAMTELVLDAWPAAGGPS